MMQYFRQGQKLCEDQEGEDRSKRHKHQFNAQSNRKIMEHHGTPKPGSVAAEVPCQVPKYEKGTYAQIETEKGVVKISGANTVLAYL
ncbi:hypothetical protein CNMCM7691_006135 [Aspergillus felis]|uniref:Uncharacterized protein n=1 Tax=Aspergillus felis TaxID=1287682 RepID=A0A8H6R6F4_9EURO|nr:hypothetical protein CNMCM7691_006135 [Aspergillus felis]